MKLQMLPKDPGSSEAASLGLEEHNTLLRGCSSVYTWQDTQLGGKLWSSPPLQRVISIGCCRVSDSSWAAPAVVSPSAPPEPWVAPVSSCSVLGPALEGVKHPVCCFLS